MRNLLSAGLPGRWLQQIRLLLPRNSVFVGIEFERAVIKLIVASGRRPRERVRHLKVKFLSSDSDEEIRRALREFVRAMALQPGTPATVAVPRHVVHAKIFRLPGQDLAELRKMAAFRLQKEIPLPLHELVYDLRIVAKEPEGHARVLAVVGRRADVERYIDLCQDAGLEVAGVRLNSEAAYHELVQTIADLPELNNQCLAMVDVDFSATNVNVIDRGDLRYCRSVGRGVSELMDRLAGPRRRNAFDEWIEELATGVAETLTAFKHDESGPPVEHIVLSGWLPKASFISQHLTESLGLPVTWFDPTIHLENHTDGGAETTTNHWFSVAALLGMAEASETDSIDLRPEPVRQTLRRRQLLRSGVHAGLLLTYLVVLLLATQGLALRHRESLVVQLRSAIKAWQPKVEAVNRWQRVQQTLKEQMGSPDLTAALLAQLLQAIPASVELGSVSFTRGESLVIHGSARRLAEVLNMPQQLARQPAFEEATILSTNRRQRQGSEEMIDFEMKINLSSDKPNP